MKKIKSEQNIGRVFIILTALLWGLAGVCVKSIPWNSMSIMASRCFIGIIMLGAVNKSLSVKCNKKTVFGAVMMSLTGILYMMAIKLTTAATAIVLQYTAPVFVFLYTVIFKKAKPKLYEIISILVVFGGCLLSFAEDLFAAGANMDLPYKTLGNLLGLASGITFAAQIIVFNEKDSDSSKGMYVSNFMSFIFCLPFMFFDKNMAFSPKIIFWVLVLGVFQYGLANIFYSKGCQKISKLECSLLLTIEPIFNPIPVFFVTGEKLGALALTGFFVVIFGITAYAVLPMLKGKKSLSHGHNTP